jgi:hypothetical protein
MQTALIALAAYLLGSISFAILTSKILRLPDPRSYGSKNPWRDERAALGESGRCGPDARGRCRERLARGVARGAVHRRSAGRSASMRRSRACARSSGTCIRYSTAFAAARASPPRRAC